MTLLDELRKKWFLDFSSPQASFPPVARHKGTHVKDYTNENKVTPLIDGQNYMKNWHDSIQTMISYSNRQMYHGSWRLDNVRTLGYRGPSSSDALTILNDADNGGVVLCPMICRNLINLRYNAPSVTWLNAHGITNACLDNRFPVAGSNHQKFSLFHSPSKRKALLGSIDIARFRWDKSDHLPVDLDRDPKFKTQPTHDVGVMIDGPAVADIEWTFRERWNDPTRRIGLLRTPPLLGPPPEIQGSVPIPPRAGSHSIQVLHTYGITRPYFGYSWSDVGEFTIWAAYLNAIKAAKKYIYIEDQYFLSFGYPPCYGRTGKARDSDIIYQLGRAIKKRGIKVVVLVPNVFEDAFAANIKYQRDRGVHYLSQQASSSSGDFVIAWLQNGTTPIYVHSKLMICDDEFVLLGSANVGQRSMTHDSELNIGIVDKKNEFAREFRKILWAEHLQRNKDSLDDPISAYKTFKEDTFHKRGRVRPYPTDYPGSAPKGHRRKIELLVDRYAGPSRS